MDALASVHSTTCQVNLPQISAIFYVDCGTTATAGRARLAASCWVTALTGHFLTAPCELIEESSMKTSARKVWLYPGIDRHAKHGARRWAAEWAQDGTNN